MDIETIEDVVVNTQNDIWQEYSGRCSNDAAIIASMIALQIEVMAKQTVILNQIAESLATLVAAGEGDEW